MHDVLDPRGVTDQVHPTRRAARLSTLVDARVALIDNGKPNALSVLQAVHERLRRLGVGEAHIHLKALIGVPISETVVEEIQQTADFAIAAIGDCGSCSLGTTSDSLVLERNGIPAVSIITEPFRVTAETVASSYGATDFEVVLARHPVASLSADGIDALADDLVGRVAALLTGTGS